MRKGAFSKLGSQPWRHVLAAGSRSQASTCCCAAARTDDVFEMRRASANVYSVHDRAQIEVNPTADRQPVQHHEAWRDGVANVQLMDETCCSVRSGRAAVARVLTAGRRHSGVDLMGLKPNAWTYLTSVLWHCCLGHLTRKNPSPIWPIMCLVGR